MQAWLPGASYQVFRDRKSCLPTGSGKSLLLLHIASSISPAEMCTGKVCCWCCWNGPQKNNKQQKQDKKNKKTKKPRTATQQQCDHAFA